MFLWRSPYLSLYDWPKILKSSRDVLIAFKDLTENFERNAICIQWRLQFVLHLPKAIYIWTHFIMPWNSVFVFTLLDISGEQCSSERLDHQNANLTSLFQPKKRIEAWAENDIVYAKKREKKLVQPYYLFMTKGLSCVSNMFFLSEFWGSQALQREVPALKNSPQQLG